MQGSMINTEETWKWNTADACNWMDLVQNGYADILNQSAFVLRSTQCELQIESPLK